MIAFASLEKSYFSVCGTNSLSTISPLYKKNVFKFSKYVQRLE